VPGPKPCFTTSMAVTAVNICVGVVIGPGGATRFGGASEKGSVYSLKPRAEGIPNSMNVPHVQPAECQDDNTC
jgi:hypothetical protein